MILTVLPAYNEAEALPRLLARFRAFQATLGEPLPVIVVDDGSRDGTADVARAEDSPGVPVDVVVHPKNRGLAGAIDTGLRRALERATSDDDLVLMMDADDTHPPDLLARMLEAKKGGADVVIASRFREGAEWHGKTWDRILFSYGVSWLFRALHPIPGVRDYTCGFRLYPVGLLRRAYDRWGEKLVASEASFACVLDLLLKLKHIGGRMVEVPLALHYDRKPGPSKMDVGRTIHRTLFLLLRRRLGWYD